MNVERLNRVRNAALAFIVAAGLTIPTPCLALATGTNSDGSTEVKDKINNLVKDEAEDNVPTKSESVYVFANADGSVSYVARLRRKGFRMTVR